MWIHQDAWFNMASLDKDVEVSYQLKKENNGVYIFVLKGDVTVNGQALNSRDGLGIWNTNELNVRANSDAEVLLMEVPMDLN